jgi:hypothetical protein
MDVLNNVAALGFLLACAFALLTICRVVGEALLRDRRESPARSPAPTTGKLERTIETLRADLREYERWRRSR